MKLVIKDLNKKFENKEVLKNINFEFEKGKIYGLLVKNGAGKNLHHFFLTVMDL